METPEYRTLLPLFDKLRGERVLVRPFREEDGQALFEAVDESREFIRPWLPFAYQHQSMEESCDWVIHAMSKWMLREEMPLVVSDAANGRFLGGLGLHPRNWNMGYFEIGYWLRQSAAGHGYMTEAVRLLVDFAMGSLKAKRLEIRCDELNTPSANVARRLGFTQEARLRNFAFPMDDNSRNILIFSLIPEDIGPGNEQEGSA